MTLQHFRKYTIFQEANRLTNEPVDVSDAKICQLKVLGAVVIEDQLNLNNRIYLHPTQDFPQGLKIN